MPFIWGEFSLYKQQSSDRWQCLNCAPRATRNSNFTPFTCFWTADGGATVLRSGCYLFFFLVLFWGFFCTVNLTSLKQNVTCPLSLVHYLIKAGKKTPFKTERQNETTALSALTIVSGSTVTAFPRGSHASFSELHSSICCRPTAPEHST